MKGVLLGIVGAIGAFLALEGLCRALPVMSGWENPPVTKQFPFVRNRPHGDYVFSVGWDLRHVVRGSFNSLGFASPEPQRGTNVAIVGDSYVEAAMLDPSDRLSALINARPTGLKSSSFGRAGADLSDYLPMAEWIVEAIKPSYLVFVITKDDLKNSFSVKKRGYWFEESSGELTLKSNVNFKARNLLLRSALASYLTYNLKFGPSVIFSRAANMTKADGAVRTESSRSMPSQAAVDGILAKLARLQRTGTTVVLAFDADREAIYRGDREVHTSEFVLMAKRAQQMGFAICDLAISFEREYASQGARFDLNNRDSHWNPAGSRVVASALIDLIAAEAPMKRDLGPLRTASSRPQELPGLDEFDK